MRTKLFGWSLALLSILPLAGRAQTETATPKAVPKPVAEAATPATLPKPASPRQLFPGLFEAVQMGRVFPDGKTFVDAAPRQRPATILAAWQREKSKPGFQLKAFVESHFVMPTDSVATFRSNVQAGLRHQLDTLWTVLARPATPPADPNDSLAAFRSLLPLPKPYIVPGGRFREMYYWDTYFTMLGLAEAGKGQLLHDLTDNFAFLISRYGFVPNGTRSYYLTRSQPPFFASMVNLIAKDQGNGMLLRYRAALESEYRYWMLGAEQLAPGTAAHRVVRVPSGAVLNRYWDESTQPREESYAEDVKAAKLSKQAPARFYRNVRAAAASGWDFSSRWFQPGGGLATIQTTDLVPVDLNCLLYQMELTLAEACRVAGQPVQARDYTAKATRRRAALLALCWDSKLGWFQDYNWAKRQRSAVRTLAGVYPLAFGLATPVQATRVAKELKSNFLRPGGLVTSLSKTGQQWDAPNGWAPLEYLAIEGLRRYQQLPLADTIAHRWIGLNRRVFTQTGKLLEKYDVVNPNRPAGGGEYPLQDGFGWTNGVLLRLLEWYKLE
ncbi:alpha,alpha-trehalase TreF [Hymenobacter sp. BT770]|uniref:alpha,alpha-trehalase TreF n=1 Tax=Hymenobacter sp. BT770 TaxID=2886942 RepID=UPI001D0F8EA0|nr:alpha,alpha-trehalase TreF [Hymenobacter sp. BT770]MCC3154270.1 alpha,alpha-trehalase TreF [Hymenobacter sp. BT770]MDO3416350.1 alpha,alpha-trehalase TreF [Hymenobacter sp. BT770]